MNNMKKIVQQPIRKVYGPSSQQETLQLNAVKKINSLLSSGAVSVTGPIQSRILKQKATSDVIQQNINQTNKIQRCYICDDACNSSAVFLTQASTITTKTKIPNKIGHIVGDAFMVIVCEDDVICNKCMSQFNQLDRFENDVERIKTNILNSIYKKYDINDDDTSISSASNSSQLTLNKSEIPNKLQKLSNSTTFVNRKIVVNSDESSEEIVTRKVPIPQTSTVKQIHQNILIRNNSGLNVDAVEHQLTNLFESNSNTTASNVTAKLQQPQQQPSQLVKRGPIKIYKCRACEFKTQDISLFQTHFETCKPIPQNQLQQTVQSNTTQVIQSGVRCKLCKKLFPNLQTLKQHNAEKHAPATETNIVTINNNEKTIPALITHYSCNLCKYETTDKRSFDEHSKKHGKIRPFKCRLCAMRFETREQASIHAKMHQPDYFKCGVCSQSFSDRDILIKHLATHEKQQTTQKLLQETIDEALRVDNQEVETANTTDKSINFFTCDICALTFIRKDYYNQHMETNHKQAPVTTSTTNNQTTIINSLQSSNAATRQAVPSAIINTTQQQTSNSISDADLESIFEKMHSDKADIDVSGTSNASTNNNNDVSNVVITSQENSVGGITFNITIPQGEDININQQEQKIIQQIKSDQSNQEGQTSVNVSMDMPVLEGIEENASGHMKTDEDNGQQIVAAPVSMPSLDDDVETQNAHGNTENVPMDLEDVHNAVDDGQIKFIINDGQLLQLNDHIITDADGNQILVQGTDSEHIQQLLQSVGVLQTGDGLDGDALHMINENNQMIIVQQDGSGEAQLIDASMLNADGQIVIQQAHEDENSQSTGEDGVQIPVSVTFTTQPTDIEMHPQQIHDDGSQEGHQQDETINSQEQEQLHHEGENETSELTENKSENKDSNETGEESSVVDGNDKTDQSKAVGENSDSNTVNETQ